MKYERVYDMNLFLNLLKNIFRCNPGSKFIKLEPFYKMNRVVTEIEASPLDL